MQSAIVIIVFLFGVLVSAILVSLTIKRNNFLWNLLTLAYAIIINVIDALVNQRNFNVIATVIFTLFLLIIGWLLAKTEFLEK